VSPKPLSDRADAVTIRMGAGLKTIDGE
jgi:hypothetical protein